MPKKKPKSFAILVDTCVWLDLARDYREQAVIGALEDLVKAGSVELILPQIALDEFDRNKARVAEETRRSLHSHFQLVSEAVNRFGDTASKADILKGLGETDHAIVMKSEVVNDSIERVEALLKSSPPLPITDKIKQRVTERAIDAKAPYHRNKNSVADAVIIETYSEALSPVACRKRNFAFITHNTKDFSELNGDRRKPHSDLVDLFSPPSSTYWVSMVDLIRQVDPELLVDHIIEMNSVEQPRRLSEILEAEHLLFRQVWYNRHWNLRTSIEDGTHHIVAEKDYSRNPYRSDQTLDSVWTTALAAVKKTEEEVGLENLGPWDDFEWGMINGKLSALRWVLGDEWDMLDT